MASTYLTRTPSSAGNRKTYTLSFWIKRSSATVAQYFFHAAAGESNPQTAIEMNTDGTLSFWDSATIMVTPIASLRDSSAWYHIVIAVDTTQGTDSNRVKFYINGVQQTTFSTASGKTLAYPSADYECAINTAVKHTIGAYNNTSGHYNGLLTHFHFIDGLAYAPSDFGESDSVSGIWKAKTAPSVTHGTNGFFLKFENSGAMGTDSSGNSNTFAVGGGTLTQTIDTPDNNFATFNSLIGNMDTLTNANLGVARSASSWRSAFASFGLTPTGKYYWEVKLHTGTKVRVGITDDIAGSAWDLQNRGQVSEGGEQTNSVSYADNGNANINTTQTVGYGGAITTSNILGVAVDMANMKMYYSKDGVWQNSGNPESGSTGTGALSIPATTGTYYPAVSMNASGYYINFGQGYFGTTQVASAGTSPSEGGIFEYDCPSGYQALCTKGINSF